MIDRKKEKDKKAALDYNFEKKEEMIEHCHDAAA